MKLSRRKFFGASAGAAIAGSSAAKNAIATAHTSMPIASGGLASEVGGIVANKTTFLDRLKRLQEALSEVDKKDIERHKRNLVPIEAARLDTLRSISPVNRARMAIEFAEQLERERNRSWLLGDISEIERQLARQFWE